MNWKTFLHVIKYIKREMIGSDGNDELCMWTGVQEDAYSQLSAALSVRESCLFYIIGLMATMAKMPDINYSARTHTCPFSEFAQARICSFAPVLSLPDCLSSFFVKLCSVKLCNTAGASWEPVSRRLAWIASALWAMQIIVFLTDVPCIFYMGSWLRELRRKSFTPLASFHRLTNIQYLSRPYTLYLDLMLIPPHAHFQPLSLKSMKLILLRLMDFAAKVRRMHFNHGRS